MLYIEYEEYKNKYNNAREIYDKILSEKEKLFSITQPKVTNYNKELVSGGTPTNLFDEYIIQKEEANIDARLKEALSIVEGRKMLLLSKREELKHSGNIYDKIYYYRCIENKTPLQIAYLIPCDKVTVYKYMKEIERHMKKMGYDLQYLYIRKHGWAIL